MATRRSASQPKSLTGTTTRTKRPSAASKRGKTRGTNAPKTAVKARARQLNDAPVGNALIGQSGGPTVVINQSLVGVIESAVAHPNIRHVYGARHGVAGILADDLLRLDNQPRKLLETVALTPAAALGSVRKKPTREECLAMFETFRKHDIAYLFYIGGNDSAETANIVLECAKAEKYPIRVIHVPKTIDNDLRVTDHCPGFGSAAKFVAQAFMGDDLDNRSLKGVKINVVMGRHAGFLTAASVLGRREPDAGPHLVYVPEVVFDEKKFVADVKRVVKRYGRCLVAVSEGVHDKRGVTLAEKQAKRAERDAHGNVQLSGSGALGDHLAGLVKASMKGARVRADTFGYLQRSFAGVYSESDAAEARQVGRDAVKFAISSRGGTVVLKRKPGKRYGCTTALAPLSRVAKFTKSMDARFVNKAGNDITPAFVRYAAPLAGELHPTALLRGL
ncbi:MAG: pyrophosphate--fructose 6-phosphate 1-phosphotransferase [Planctomycetota bacterium]|nr:MAG: pyrophosphate--fructose 6-phosphate 1-phosphotransferase [Planctomycetota bacterium]